MAENTRPAKKAYEAVATLADLGDFKNSIDDEFRSLRRDMHEFQREISNLVSQKTDTNWGTILTALTVVLIMAGMGGALVNNLIGSEREMRASVNEDLREQDARTEKLLDMVSERELQDAYSRGKSNQRFETLESLIQSAVENRKDIDEKHVASQEALDKKIDEVSHALDNGLGRRIDEKIAPHNERFLALERVVFGDTPNYRDYDRK